MGTQRRTAPGWLLALVGAAVAFGGAVTYFTVFARFPALRDVPWVSLPLTLAGAAIGAWGAVRAFRGASGWGGRIVAVAGAGLAVLFAAALTGYVFWLSAQVPEPTAVAESLAVAPDVVLYDPDGAPVTLADLRGTKVVVVFYRGFW